TFFVIVDASLKAASREGRMDRVQKLDAEASFSSTHSFAFSLVFGSCIVLFASSKWVLIVGPSPSSISPSRRLLHPFGCRSGISGDRFIQIEFFPVEVREEIIVSLGSIRLALLMVA
ncbi:hypothetical protein PMAYCL1PPCAC_05765, partial [Pristionchus mayeri]